MENTQNNTKKSFAVSRGIYKTTNRKRQEVYRAKFSKWGLSIQKDFETLEEAEQYRDTLCADKNALYAEHDSQVQRHLLAPAALTPEQKKLVSLVAKLHKVANQVIELGGGIEPYYELDSWVHENTSCEVFGQLAEFVLVISGQAPKVAIGNLGQGKAVADDHYAGEVEDLGEDEDYDPTDDEPRTDEE